MGGDVILFLKAHIRAYTRADGTVVQAHDDRRRPGRKRPEPRLRMGVDRLIEAARSMESWKDWYERHEAIIRELFADDADLFRGFLSATSQAAAVPANVGLALKAYRQHWSGEDFTGYIPAVIGNLRRAVAEESMVGDKISEYQVANTEAGSAGIAVDRHISMLMFGRQKPTAAMKRKAKRVIRGMSERLGWEPRAVQAALWAYNQVRTGTDPGSVRSYDAILSAKADQIAAMRAQLGRLAKALADYPLSFKDFDAALAAKETAYRRAARIASLNLI